MMPVRRAELSQHLRMYHLSRELLTYLRDPKKAAVTKTAYTASLAEARTGYEHELRTDIYALGGLASPW